MQGVFQPGWRRSEGKKRIFRGFWPAPGDDPLTSDENFALDGEGDTVALNTRAPRLSPNALQLPFLCPTLNLEPLPSSVIECRYVLRLFPAPPRTNPYPHQPRADEQQRGRFWDGRRVGHEGVVDVNGIRLISVVCPVDTRGKFIDRI